MGFEMGADDLVDLQVSARREWLLTDGCGGFAMGTAAGLNTRRYHAHWIAAIDPPADRMVLLDSVEAFAEVGGVSYGLSANQYPGTIHPEGYKLLTHFEATPSWVEWTFSFARAVIVKRIWMGAKGVVVRYSNLGKRPVKMAFRPLIAHKPYHENFEFREGYPESFEMGESTVRIEEGGVPLEIGFGSARCQPVQGWYYRFEHAREAERGLNPRDDLYCPCELTCELLPGADYRLFVGEPGSSPPEVPEEDVEGRSLTAAAGRFLVSTPSRTTIMAGYPWFADWGRDTMISIPGICVATGRTDLARRILLDYAGQTSQGLIPNRFVEGAHQPDYNTADASLWFVNAVYRTLEAEWDPDFALSMRRVIEEIVDWHRLGTMYGIRMDPSDGLITQGVSGAQLTWMDAKIGDWVVTPRHGKPVEINGLWINALRVLAWLLDRLGDNGGAIAESADLAEEAFHRRFWSEHHGWYFDTIDPHDAQLRPNQLIPLALPFGPLDAQKAEATLAATETHLVTPYGIRTLAPFELHYAGRFRGPVHALDAAYHQGTVWPWLLGIYWQACDRDRGAAAQDVLRSREEKAIEMLSHLGFGGIAECYDGDPPHEPNGCPWQAWSVATIVESLNCRNREGG